MQKIREILRHELAPLAFVSFMILAMIAVGVYINVRN